MTGLAELLVEAGHSVTVLYTRGIHLSGFSARKWIRFFRDKKIDFVPLRPSAIGRFVGPLFDVGYTVPAAVYDYLQGSHFDVVHFNDTDGDGFLSICAHALGTLLPNAVFYTAVHSPREWICELNEEPVVLPVDALMRAGERLSIAGCDTLWGPSRYLLQWLESHDYELPARVIQQQYVMPSNAVSRPSQDISEQLASPIQSIVFFGRLEERKGLRIFLDAVELILPELIDRRIKLVFLGRVTKVAGQSSADLIRERSRGWQLNIEILGDYGQSAALQYLLQVGRLAVIASPADNSPCTVYECVELEIPFVAACTGGIPELIHSQDHPRVLFEHNANALSDALRRSLDEENTPARPAVGVEANVEQWLGLHDADLPAVRKRFCDDDSTAQVIAVIEHTAGDRNLSDTVASLEQAGIPTQQMRLISARHREPDSNTDEIERLETDGLSALIAQTQPLLFIYAGLRLTNPEQLLPSIDDVPIDSCDGFLLSALGSDNRRLDAPAMRPVVSYLYGPCPAGAAVLLAQGQRRLGDLEWRPSSGPFLGLLDAAIVSGAQLWPHPALTVDSAEPGPARHWAPTVTKSRMGLYASVHGAERENLMVQAAVSASNPLAIAVRRLAYRFAATRLSGVLPYLSRLRR